MPLLLDIQDLHAYIGKKEILHNVDLQIAEAETHVIMGKNGAGKSTLVQSIMGNPLFQIEAKSFVFRGENLQEKEATERALLGIFLSFQQAVEIPGLKIYGYLRLLYNKTHQKKLSPPKFREFIRGKLDLLALPESLLLRSLNDGFSGGEKKKMEVLQMLVLEPKLIILDEIDSGLDIDALKLVAKAIKELQKKNQSSLLLITHYHRFLEDLSIDHVHLMKAGEIVRSGTAELAREIDRTGFKEKTPSVSD